MQILQLLFIDDDDINNYVLEDTFASVNNIEANFIADGQTAYEHINQLAVNSPTNLPDIIFLDIKMPGFDGFDILDLLEKDRHLHNKTTEIFILSSTVDRRDEEKAQSYPLVRELVSKPLTLDKFWNLMKKHQIISEHEI